jgi:hypothetical protein
VSNRRKIDLIKLAAVLDKPPAVRRLPDRRVRACCTSRQGSPHLADCDRPTWASARQLADDIHAALGDPKD